MNAAIAGITLSSRDTQRDNQRTDQKTGSDYECLYEVQEVEV
jgi:hypothetical protein